MAEFAIASISSLALHNKNILIAGNAPFLGSWIGTRPEFDWSVALALFVPIGVVHLILLALIIISESYRRSPESNIPLRDWNEGSTERLVSPARGG